MIRELLLSPNNLKSKHSLFKSNIYSIGIRFQGEIIIVMHQSRYERLTEMHNSKLQKIQVLTFHLLSIIKYKYLEKSGILVFHILDKKLGHTIMFTANDF